MAFSFRKIISNIGYFKKPGDDEIGSTDSHNDPEFDKQRCISQLSTGDAEIINFERPEPDSTSIQCATSLKLPESVRNFATKKGSLSDTDLLTVNMEKGKKEKQKSRKLKVDIKKANKSFDETVKRENVENTPTHVLLECKSSEIFSERMKQFDFSKSFEIDSDVSSYEEDENFEIESLSDISLESEDKTSIKMCRKVSTDSQSSNEGTQLVPAASIESFGDVEIDKNEEERVATLLNYQMKFEKMEGFLNKMLTEFQFHIEVSKIFNTRSLISSLAGHNTHMPKQLDEVSSMENNNRGISPTGSWNIVLDKEDRMTKIKLKNQLLSIRNIIDEFINTNLKNQSSGQRPMLCKKNRSITFDLHKGKRMHKLHVSNKKKIRHFDFPDIREAMINLFSPDDNTNTVVNASFDESDMKCNCNCHLNSPCSTETDSGVTKSVERSMSITSSIGNFILDSSTLTAYSESLDQIISYNSFQDASLYSTLLQKAAIERITFYVQVHSIQLKCETEQDYETKNLITFFCPACKSTENEENGLLKHILGQYHCEKIHFLYKTAYIKKCVQAGKEIQPSTVLNPMKMYRDDNKIVCFGDAMYACSLCFENLIVGESILMAHCSEPEHVERREKLPEILE
ncbi:uncharacterized protein LOC126379439 [Pectinophora gossypiella]|uniref:Uncharacterized protein n=1 Tax=Pectinophora gossypiella TaxID=13191 RepID=A0A1E1W6R4_PECGO|nr:uncharacterized protein LOC126379439 [Pectinophora gossypiella]